MAQEKESKEIIKNLQKRLKDNIKKAKEFAESNTKRNAKGEVLWGEEE